MVFLHPIGVDLSRVLTPDSLMPLLGSQEFREQLAPFLPAGEELPHSPTELSNTLHSPQFQQVRSPSKARTALCNSLFDSERKSVKSWNHNCMTHVADWTNDVYSVVQFYRSRSC